MDIFKIIGVGFITAISALIVKQIKPEVSIVIGMAGGVVMLIMLIDAFSSIVSSFGSMITKSGLTSGIFSTVLKIIGVGYITEFSANLCADAGSSSIADKILLGGKIIIMLIAIPIVNSIIEIISGLLS